MDSEPQEKAEQQLLALKMYYDALLETLESGVLVIDASDTVISENERVLKLWDLNNKLTGEKLPNTEFWQRCPELKQYLEESRRQSAAVHFDCYANPSTMLNVIIKPLIPASGSAPLGTLIYMENVTPQLSLRSIVEGLAAAAEELQSTNEELEVIDEQLQFLKQELETTNEELSSRTRELDEVKARYSEMMERMPWPVLLADQNGLIYMFNSAAQKLFGFAEASERGMKLEELPIDKASRQAMLRQHQSAVEARKRSSLRKLHLATNRFNGETDVHFTPLTGNSERHGVILMFEVQQAKKASRNPRNSTSGAKKTSGPKKKKEGRE